MRGTYRLKLLYRGIRQRWLERQAERAVARFPTVKDKAPHGLATPLIVTLTSFPPRLPMLAKTLKSLLDQHTRPDRVVLWLAHEDIEQLPADVLALREHGLETTPSGGAGMAALIAGLPGLGADARVLAILSEGPEDG